MILLGRETCSSQVQRVGGYIRPLEPCGCRRYAGQECSHGKQSNRRPLQLSISITRLGCIGGTASRIHRCKIPGFQVSEHAKVRIVALNTSREPPPDLAGLQLRPEEDADALRTNQFPAPGRSPRSSLIIFHPHVRRTIMSGTSLYVTKVKWRCLNSLAPILKRLRRIEYAETLQTSP